MAESSLHEERNVRLLLVDRLRLLGTRSSFHGVSSFIRTSHLSVKILYAICFTISFSFCTVTLVENVQDFLNYKVKTVVELHHDSDADFLTVTICEKQICVFTDYEYNKFIDFYIQDTYNQSGDLTE